MKSTTATSKHPLPSTGAFKKLQLQTLNFTAL